MTTDNKTRTLYIWDLESGKISFKLSSEKIIQTIIEVIEIKLLKLVAVSSLDKLITIWNFNKQHILLEIKLSHSGVHTIRYFESYQVLLTAGYENSISIFTLNPSFLDTQLDGMLFM